MIHIILTETQADVVRGSTGPHSSLEPVPLASGIEWALPVAVLSDPAHAAHHDYLSALTQREVAAEEWPQTEEPE
ncbi:MAG: hypothetical protein VX529_10935 [Pseudomonadota bacterium]|nr:hypothetical protein [Pseudomonadota bacterium]